MYTIVTNNTPIWASNAAVKAHVEQQLSGKHPVSVINKWTEEFRNSLGVYTPATVRETLDDYQDLDSGTLTFDGTTVTVTYAAVDLSLERAKEQALSDIASKRYDVEVGGVDLNGTVVSTDRESQNKYIAVRIIAKEDPAYTVTWKTLNGFVTLDATSIISIADGVRNHVQSCYDREAELAALIDGAADLTELRTIDLDAGWPANPDFEAA